MGFNKKFFTTGGIVASTPPSGGGAFDPLQNFETVTYTGNGSTQKITGYIRKGAAFNGSSSKVVLPNSSFQTSAFTVSAWCNVTANGSENSIFEFTDTNSGDNQSVILLSAGSTSKSSRFLFRNRTTNEYSYEPIGTPLSGWNHYCMTFDGSTVKSYINGSEVDSASFSITNTIASTSEVLLGLSAGDRFLNGSIDQVRIFDKALSQGEVDTLEAETYDSSTKSTTDIFGDGSGVALYELDEDANGTAPSEALVETNQLINLRAENYTSGSTWTDISGQNNNATLTNPTKPTTESVHFDYADLGAQNQYGGNNVSIEFFIKTTNTDDDYFLTAYNAGGLISGEMLLYIPSSAASGKPYLRVSGSTSSSSQLAFNHTVVQGEWTHYVLVYDSSLTGNTNRFIMYVNGVEVTTSVIGGVDSFDNSNFMGDTSTLFIGKRGGGTDYEEMDIKEFRIYSKSLSSQEVAQNYAASAFKYNGTPTSVNFLGMAFQPDLVWIKQRTGGGNNSLFDSIRGIEKYLISNSTIQETDFSGVNGLISFDANGFTVDDTGGLDYSVNHSGDYVAWCWKAGGAVTPNNNTNGTITSTVSANTDAGFSIVKFTSPSANTTGFTIGHGLSSAPDLIITKPTDAAVGWHVYSSAFSTPSQSYLQLQTTGTGSTIDPNTWNNTAATSTVFSMKTGYAVGTSSETIAYCFHSVVGYQKVGIYDGGTITSSNIVNLGFRPRFVLLKPTQTTNDWLIYDTVRDTTNPYQNILYPATAGAEQVATNDDYNLYLTDDGFYFNNTNGFINSSASDVIYLAIA